MKQIIVILTSLFILVGCASKLDKPNVSSRDNLKNITVSADKIYDLTTDPEIQGETDNIKSNAEVVGKNIEKTDAYSKKLEELLAKEKERTTKWMNYCIGAAIIFGGLATVISIGLLLAGYLKTVLFTVVAGGIFLGGIMLKAIAVYYLWIGGAVAIGLVVLLIRSILRYKKSTKEVVETNEKLKASGVLSKEDLTQAAKSSQSPSTEKLVNEAQAEIKKETGKRDL